VVGTASAQSGTFEIVDVSPEEATLERWEFIEISVVVENVGDESDTQTVGLRVAAIPEVTVAEKELTLDPGERDTVVLNAEAIFPPGEYTPVVSTDDDEFRGAAVITEPDDPDNETDTDGNTTDTDDNTTDTDGNTTDTDSNTTSTDGNTTDTDDNTTDTDDTNGTDETDGGDGSGAGFGILTALAGVSGLGYLYRRRLESG